MSSLRNIWLKCIFGPQFLSLFKYQICNLIRIKYKRSGIVLLGLIRVVQARGTNPQLHARTGGKTKRRRPNLWSYEWNLLVIGLETKQAQAFNN